MSHARSVILGPIVTEKTTNLAAQGVYTFEVAPKANKLEIAQAVEEIFDVKVASVNTVNLPGKPKRRGMAEGRTKSWKKAYVKIQTAPTTLTYKGKGGTEQTSKKEFKTEIEHFGYGQ